MDRLSAVKDKSGVFTGLFAINPVNSKPIPVWVADYVLGSYGTGAIMAVPGHDQRDFDFAQRYGLEIVQVIESPADWEQAKAYPGQGKLINSGQFTGQEAETAKKNISKYIEEHKLGSVKVNYHLRDWLISRQRYWGPPIPVIYCRHCWRDQVESGKLKVEGLTEGWDYTKIEGEEYMIRLVPEKNLPVLLPEVEDFKPLGTGKSPLASVERFVQTTCPECSQPASRETDVSDTFLDSTRTTRPLREPPRSNRNKHQLPSLIVGSIDFPTTCATNISLFSFRPPNGFHPITVGLVCSLKDVATACKS